MGILLGLLYLLVPVLVIAWFTGWRRETRERLDDVQARLDRIEGLLLRDRRQIER